MMLFLPKYHPLRFQAAWKKAGGVSGSRSGGNNLPVSMVPETQRQNTKDCMSPLTGQETTDEAADLMARATCIVSYPSSHMSASGQSSRSGPTPAVAALSLPEPLVFADCQRGDLEAGAAPGLGVVACPPGLTDDGRNGGRSLRHDPHPPSTTRRRLWRTVSASLGCRNMARR